MNTGFKYTDYCTVFYFEEKGKHKVQMYDEINDRPLKTVTLAVAILILSNHE